MLTVLGHRPPQEALPKARAAAMKDGEALSADNLRKKRLSSTCRRAEVRRIDWHTLRHYSDLRIIPGRWAIDPALRVTI